MMKSSFTQRFLLSMLFALPLLPAGCSGYSHSMKEVQQAVAHGQQERALELLNEKLRTSSAQQLPRSLSDHQVLYLVERATVLQALGEFDLAARDMMVADNRLEYLDLDHAGSLELGKYLYSERATTYRAPAYERLLLNTLNMLNFLAVQNPSGARVEARRFALIEEFFVDHNDQSVSDSIRALGNYLGGVAFEQSGNFDEAARYYGRAYYFGFQPQTFRDRLIDLYRITDHHPGELRSGNESALQDITSAANEKGRLSPDAYREEHIRNGDTLVIIQTGMVPYKTEERIPVHRAIDESNESNHPRFQLSIQQRTQFRQVSTQARLSFVPFPALTQGNLPTYRDPDLRINNPPDVSPEPFPVVDLSRQVKKAWQQKRGALLVAAITRILTRLLAAGVVSHNVGQKTGSRGLGLFTGLLTYFTLSALDRPDTRSWVTLPAGIRMYRTSLKPGPHTFTVQVGSKTFQRTVEIHKNKLNIVNFSRAR